MRKFFILAFGTVLMFMLVACGGNKVDDSTADQYITQAEEVIALLNENKNEEVHAMFNDEMKTGLPIEDMAEISSIIQNSGSFEKIDQSSVEKEDSYYVTVLVAKYSDENRAYTITFNEDEKIAGLYIK